MKTVRKLTQRETAIIVCLLAQPFPGRDELREQMLHAKAMPIEQYDDNYSSVTFEVRDGPRAAVKRRVPVDAVAEDSDGVPIEVLLHVVDGVIDELEIYKADGTPIKRQPEASDLTVRTYQA